MKSTYKTWRTDAAFRRSYRQDALTEQNGQCCYCYRTLTARTATLEHVKPVSKGGFDSRDNSAAACVECNKARGNMSQAAFKRLLKHPPSDDLGLLILRATRRINLAANRACKRIRSLAR